MSETHWMSDKTEKHQWQYNCFHTKGIQNRSRKLKFIQFTHEWFVYAIYSQCSYCISTAWCWCYWLVDCCRNLNFIFMFFFYSFFVSFSHLFCLIRRDLLFPISINRFFDSIVSCPSGYVTYVKPSHHFAMFNVFFYLVSY